MQLCRSGRGGMCITHGQAMSECEDDVKAIKSEPLRAGGVEWTVDPESNTVRHGDINLSLTELAMLQTAVQMASGMVGQIGRS